MQIALGKFAKEGIEIDLDAPSLASGVHTAVQQYTDKLSSERRSLAPPAFLDSKPSRDSGSSLELLLEDEVLAALEREASSHSVSVEQVAVHAVLVHLAEADAIGAISDSGS